MSDSQSRIQNQKITYRRASAADQRAIRALIREAQLNPLSLDWPRFLLAVDDTSGAVVGTGQIKAHGDGSREMASIAVRPAYQGRGIATEIVRRLIAQDARESDAPLYLLCAGDMPPFYERFGFHRLEPATLPPYFRRLTRLTTFAQVFVRAGLTPVVMALDVERKRKNAA